MRQVSRIVLVLVVVTAASLSLAKPEFVAVLQGQYRPAAGTALATASCVACHTTPPTHNAYGAALKALMGRRAPTLAIANLQAVEGEDSDQDGWLNGDELRQGFLPGDPESHPDAAPDALEDTTPRTSGTVSPPSVDPIQPPSAAVEAPLIPTHSFHPAVVHFPIALILFGVLLEILGVRKGSSALRQAGKWNLMGGVIATVVVIPTGFAAYLRKGFPLEGPTLIHLILALGGTALVACALRLRLKAERSDPGYWALLLGGAAAIAVAGHFGSVMVFG